MAVSFPFCEGPAVPVAALLCLCTPLVPSVHSTWDLGDPWKAWGYLSFPIYLSYSGFRPSFRPSLLSSACSVILWYDSRMHSTLGLLHYCCFRWIWQKCSFCSSLAMCMEEGRQWVSRWKWIQCLKGKSFVMVCSYNIMKIFLVGLCRLTVNCFLENLNDLFNHLIKF